MNQSSTDKASQTTPVSDIIDDLADAADDQPVTVGKIVDAFGHRGFGAILAAAALISISPIGAIPGASVVIALILILVASQLAIGRDYPWLPGFVSNRKIGSDRIDRAVDKMRQWSRPIDRHVHARFEFLLAETAIRIMAVAVALLALSFVPVILVPWGVVLPSLIVLLFGIAILSRDGLAALMAWLACPLWLWAFWRLTALAT